MKISAKYQKALDNYLVWSKCTTPFSNTAWAPHIVEGLIPKPDGLSAAEVLFQFETFGKDERGNCREPDLLSRYHFGKKNRDWWTKEIGWWNKWAGAYAPEEFCGHLVPECFCELFKHYPRPHFVRWLHDNSYTEEMLNSDVDFRLKGLERVQGGVEII